MKSFYQRHISVIDRYFTIVANYDKYKIKKITHNLIHHLSNSIFKEGSWGFYRINKQYLWLSGWYVAVHQFHLLQLVFFMSSNNIKFLWQCDNFFLVTKISFISHILSHLDRKLLKTIQIQKRGQWVILTV